MAAYAARREQLGLPQDARGAPAAEYAAGLAGLTEEQLGAFLERCRDKYRGKRIDPGASWTGWAGASGGFGGSGAGLGGLRAARTAEPARTARPPQTGYCPAWLCCGMPQATARPQ